MYNKHAGNVIYLLKIGGAQEPFVRIGGRLLLD